MVVVSIEVSYFDVFYRSLKGFEGGAIALLFDDHSVLASDQQTISGLHPTDATLNGVRLNATTAENTSATSKISGATWQYGHAHLKRYPLVAITSSPLETILAPWRESSWRSALSSLLRLVLLALLGAILLFQIRSRHKAEAILEESAMQFRLVIDRIEDYGIYTLDTAGVITSWNAGAQRLTGLTAEEVIGLHCSALYAAEDVAAGHPERTLTDALRTGRNEDERWRLRKDGTRFLVNAITTPLYDAAGRHYGFLKVGRDVTASREFACITSFQENGST